MKHQKIKNKAFTPHHFYTSSPVHKPFSKKSGGGFTIIELLVVIAIIGVLAGVVVLTSIRGIAQSRDARRVQELYQIANALQQYYAIYDQYPDNTDTDLELGCWGDWDRGNQANETDDFIKPLIDEGFLTNIPREWISPGCTYRYTKVTNPCGGCFGETFAVLYAACETNKCPTGEKTSTCFDCWSEGSGANDPYDIAIFLKEK